MVFGLLALAAVLLVTLDRIMPARGAARATVSLTGAERPIVQTAALPITQLGWAGAIALLVVASLAASALGLLFVYLRRVLPHLDPTSAFLERMRMTFDAFTDGVLVIDLSGRIVLANTAFRRLHAGAGQALEGCRLSELAWLKPALPANPQLHPWTQAVRQRTAVTGEPVEIAQLSGEPRTVVINSAPIMDKQGWVRGSLITFDDVTALHRANAELRRAMTELKVSNNHVEEQNRELRDMVTRDPLTGCLNRRAFFEQLDELFAQARQRGDELCCVMTDIDHFKKVNDRYGHGAGDQLLRAVAKILAAGLRQGDLICRYGGEEFCVVLPGVDLQRAEDIAERLRQEIQRKAGDSLRTTKGQIITSSFGIAAISQGAADPSVLIDQADTALYSAKDAGRNRVEVWQGETPTPEDVSRHGETQPPEQVTLWV